MTSQGTAVNKKTSAIPDLPAKARDILVKYTDDGAKLDLEDIDAVVSKIDDFFKETGRTDWTKDDVKKIRVF